MADDSRSPPLCPWDPGEACRSGNGACLPPRKRLLAGLKQNGWLSSSPSCSTAFGGAPCTGLMEEVNLEVNLTEANEDNCSVHQAVIAEQGECHNAIETFVPMKCKKATKRRKRLSILADCPSYGNKSQGGEIKLCPEDKVQKEIGGDKTVSASIVALTMGKECVAHKEMVAAARATADMAAKTAAKAKAIALDKAAAAAKAAAVARAALEALALVACQPNSHILSSKKRKRKEDDPKQAPFMCESKSRLSSSAPPKSKGSLHNIRLSLPLASASEPRMLPSIDELPVCVDALIDKRQHDEQTQLSPISRAAIPPTSPVDDEEMARQLHRAMNSSPRISRNQRPSESSKKDETSPPSIQSNRQRARGCHLLRNSNQIKKENSMVLRTINGRADVKLKSMSAINAALNMRQGTSFSENCVVPCHAGSQGAGINMSFQKGNTCCSISGHAFTSLTKCSEEDHTLIADHKGAISCCQFYPEAECKSSIQVHGAEYFRGEKKGSNGLLMKKALKLSGSKVVKRNKTGKSLISAPAEVMLIPQNRGSNNADEEPPTSSESHLAIPSNMAVGSYCQTYTGNGQINVDEKQGNANEASLDSTSKVAGKGFKGLPILDDTHNPSKAARIYVPPFVQGERQTRRQKISGVL